ncbi:MAG: protein kinase [Gemmataceae bacterium]
MELTVQNVYGLLLRSQLLSLEEARAMYSRWQDEAGENVTNLARFAAWMVSNKFLTEYQASLLARGHADGFFLNEYRILDRIGKGRMAGVYRAQHRLGQMVAIKVLPPSRAKDPNTLARFQREARLAMRLKHPNVVRGFQMDQAGDLHYLVMEHLEGVTVEELQQARRQLPPEEAVRIVYQALEGLDHIHQQGLVHRDLKPANLMLVPPPSADSTLGCTVKILDIGLGRALLEDTQEGSEQGLTSEGVILGTPDYMAPEQARDPRLADIRADIYSLGCVLYHLLAGQPPFPDTNIISQMIRHATESPRPLSEFNPHIPEGLEQILGWMIAKDSAARYPTPARAARALEVYLAAGTGKASSTDLDPGLRSYLTWLEAEESRHDVVVSSGAPTSTEMKPLPPTVPLMTLPGVRPPSGTLPTAKPPSGSAVSKPPSGAIPSAPPVPGKSPGKAATPSEKPAHEKHRSKKKPASSPSAPKPPSVPPTVEVELVALPPGSEQASPAPFSLAHLTRRDFILFFLGVGSGLTAYAIGRGLAALFSRPRRVDSE